MHVSLYGQQMVLPCSCPFTCGSPVSINALTCMCDMRLRHASSVQTTTVFVKFLREASTFYALLTLKLQATFGQLGFALEFPGLDDLAAATQQTDIPEYKTSLDCRISIYRCLICLGDLARCTIKHAFHKQRI